jgi:hypothetical protein
VTVAESNNYFAVVFYIQLMHRFIYCIVIIVFFHPFFVTATRKTFQFFFCNFA